jgi:hypothetical protein
VGALETHRRDRRVPEEARVRSGRGKTVLGQEDQGCFLQVRRRRRGIMGIGEYSPFPHYVNEADRELYRFIPSRDGLDLATSFSLLPGSTSSSNSSTPSSASKGKRKAPADCDAQTGAFLPFPSFSPVSTPRFLQKRPTRPSSPSSAPSSSDPPLSKPTLASALPLPPVLTPNTPPPPLPTIPLPARNRSSTSPRRRERRSLAKGRRGDWTARRMSGIV